MKKKYEMPEIEWIKFNILNTLATSIPSGGVDVEDGDIDLDDIV